MQLTLSYKAKMKSTFSFKPFLSDCLISCTCHPSKYHTSHTVPASSFLYGSSFFVGACSDFFRQELSLSCILILQSFPFFSPFSNRSRTPPTFTSQTCLCPWTSRSWRTCWSPSARPFPLASSVTPTEPAGEWVLPGISFGCSVTCVKTTDSDGATSKNI